MLLVVTEIFMLYESETKETTRLQGIGRRENGTGTTA